MLLPRRFQLEGLFVAKNEIREVFAIKEKQCIFTFILEFGINEKLSKIF